MGVWTTLAMHALQAYAQPEATYLSIYLSIYLSKYREMRVFVCACACVRVHPDICTHAWVHTQGPSAGLRTVAVVRTRHSRLFAASKCPFTSSKTIASAAVPTAVGPCAPTRSHSADARGAGRRLPSLGG